MLLEVTLILIAVSLIAVAAIVVWKFIHHESGGPTNSIPYLVGGWLDWDGDNRMDGNARKVLANMISGPSNYLVVNVDWTEPSELTGYIKSEELPILSNFRKKGGLLVIGFGGKADQTDDLLFSKDTSALKQFTESVRNRQDFDGLNLDYEAANMWERFHKFANWIRAVDDDPTCYIGAKNLFILDTCEAGCLGPDSDRQKFFQGMSNLMKELKRVKLYYEQEAYENNRVSVTNIKNSLKRGFQDQSKNVIMLYAMYGPNDTLGASGLTFEQAVTQDKKEGFGGTALWYVSHSKPDALLF